MFPTRYFPDRGFAPRYFAKTGETVLVFIHRVIEAHQVHQAGAVEVQRHVAGAVSHQVHQAGPVEVDYEH